MKVWIDQTYCTGSGLCQAIEPRVFALGDNGLAGVLHDGQVLPLGPGDAATVPADLAIIRLRRLFADSIRLLEAGHDPLARGEGCDFTQVVAASQIIDASQDWRDLVPGHQGSKEPAN